MRRVRFRYRGVVVKGPVLGYARDTVVNGAARGAITLFLSYVAMGFFVEPPPTTRRCSSNNAAVCSV